MTETAEVPAPGTSGLADGPDATGPVGAEPLPESPYKGLIPYDDTDSAFFFGRDSERQLIAANLVSSRLTLLYGESGAGKTSVLRAGVVHDLRNRAIRAVAAGRTPDAIVVEFATWRDEPLVGLAQAIERSVRLVYGEATPTAPPATNLSQLLRDWTDRLDADLLLILDQFEEYLLYHEDEDGPGTFASELPVAVTDRTLRANFLVAIREDALSRLDRFEDGIPGLYANNFRLEHLDRDAARDAILQPVEEYDRRSGQPPHSIEPALVERVLDEVSRGQVVVEQAGQGTVSEAGPSTSRIETPYLQLVLSRLWDEEALAGSRVMRLSTLERLNGAKAIVQNHLDDAMAALSPARRDVAARVFQYLVTSAGAKISLSAEELAGFSEVPVGEIEPILRDLADLPVDGETRADAESARILKAVAPPPGSDVVRYEIYHDVLGPAILDWRTRYGLAAVRTRARRRVRIFAIGVVAALALTGVAVIVAVQAQQSADQARAAEQQAQQAAEQARAAEQKAQQDAEEAKAAAAQAQAKAQAHMVLAISQLGIDPQASIHHALTGWNLLVANNITNRASAEETIRLALSSARLTAVTEGHTGIVWFASFSPDGTKIVTASEDGTARIADAATGKTLQLLGQLGASPAGDPVIDAQFTPDGRMVVTAGVGGNAKVWDVLTGKLMWTLDHTASDADATGVVLSRTDGWDTKGQYIATGPFTADSHYVVTAAGLNAFIWDLETGGLVATFKHPSHVDTAAFSGDGARIVTGADDGMARIWDVGSPERVPKPMDNETSWVNVAAFSPDGAVIASGNSNGSSRLWDAATGKLIEKRAIHDDVVVALAFSADGTQLVTGGGSTAAVYDIADLVKSKKSTLVSFLDPSGAGVKSVSFSPDGTYVVTSFDDGTAHVAVAANGYDLDVLRGSGDTVSTARFSRDGNRLVTASEDHIARVWDVGSGIGLIHHSKPVTVVAFSPDGRTVATGSVDESAALWDVGGGQPRSILQGVEAAVTFFAFTDLSFNDDGTQLLTLQSNGRVERWDVASGDSLGVCCKLDDTRAKTATFVPGRPGVALVGYGDGVLRLWDLSGDAAGTQIDELDPKHSFTTNEVVWVSPDGSRILTVGRYDRLAKVWDASTLTSIGEWKIGPIRAGGFSPDGRRLLIAGGTTGARIVDPSTGDDLLPPLLGSSPITAATFSPDGKWIVTGQLDGSTRVWDASTGTLLAELHMQARLINSVAVHDGTIVAGSADNTAKVFTCPICGSIDDVIRAAKTQADVFEPEMTQPADPSTGGTATSPAASPLPSPSGGQMEMPGASASPGY